MSDSAPTSKIRLLVVGFGRTFVSGLRSLIADPKFEFIGPCAPSQALSESQSLQPDVVFCDWDMAEVSARELIRQLKDSSGWKSKLVVVAIEGKDSEAMSQLVLCGADALLPKESVRFFLAPQIELLLKARANSVEPLRGKLPESVKTLIGTYKHDLANSMAVFDGSLRKLKKSVPAVLEDPSMERLQKELTQMILIINKLGKLRDYSESSSTSDAAGNGVHKAA